MRRRALLVAGWAPWASAHAGPIDTVWVDAERGRELPLRIRRPVGDGPWPLVVHSHGLGGSRDGGDVWGEAWSAAGIVVLHVQHPGSDIDVARRGLSALRAAGSLEQLRARVADLRFVLTEAARRARAGDAALAGVQPDAVGVAGHSFGGHTAMALAGRRYPLSPAFDDPRPKAFLVLSPSPAEGMPTPQAAFGAIDRPCLLVTGSDDGDPFGRYERGEPRAAVYDALPPGRRALLWLEGADHMTLAGNGQSPIRGAGPFRRRPAAVEREAVHHQLVARLGALWWRAHLAGDAAAAQGLRSPTGLAAGDRWRSD